MHRLQFHYTLSRDSSPATVRNPLMDLLQAVASAGSISAAARSLGLSYRHVWGELKRWELELGHELIVWEKGQAARLTAFAAKLMWAERQAQARLAPQIDALRAELERTFAVAFDDNAHVVTLYASHDDALLALREHALALADSATLGPLHLDIRFVGSVDAIRALNEGRCVMAGFHTLDACPAGSVTARAYKPLLQPGLHKIIGFARRTQGLMVAPDNPLGLASLRDASRRQARFSQRALGSGTRVLLEELLVREGLAPTALNEVGAPEPSHTAVAHAIAAGMADTGLGIEAAARAQGLAFVPLAQERYHLVCLKSALQAPAIEGLRRLLAESAWQNRLWQVLGYTPDAAGDVLALSAVLPWWHYRKQKVK